MLTAPLSVEDCSIMHTQRIIYGKSVFALKPFINLLNDDLLLPDWTGPLHFQF